MPHLHDKNTILIVLYTIFVEILSEWYYNIYITDGRRVMLAIW